ncbi:TPA: bile acid:sodium symporter family protein [Methanosarcinaceae archaeon]|nr:bile acid:sodium symporter family protein [Methanosarcinaceae archaeon]
MVETASFSSFLETIGVLATMIFVLTSMLGMGFSLTVPQIVAPLRNTKLVLLSLAANFILVPLLALGILFIFLPLAIALFVRARYEEVANGLLPLMNQATSLSLLVLFVAFFVVYISDLLGVIGTTAVIAAVLFLLISFIIGYFFGGSAGPIRSVLGLGTAQRNLSAALAIATLNFTDPDVMVMIMVVSLAGLILLMFIGGELGKHAEVEAEAVPEKGKTSTAPAK